MTKRGIALVVSAAVIGFCVAKVDDHVEPTMWGWVWKLTPEKDTIKGHKVDQFVRCPNGDMIFGPWHVYVLYDYQAPWKAFLQERGR